MAPDDPNELVGRTFGDRYRVIGSIGVGAVSEVVVAEDLSTAQRVAVKVFDQAVGEDPELTERVVRRLTEARSVEHPNIVSLLDWGLDGVRLWVVSELCAGGSVRSLVDAGNRLTPSQALVMSLELARALAHAHAHGLTHRGVKPENVLFSQDQRLKVSDFGLSAVLEDVPLVRPSAALDQVRYISPEQAAGRVVGPPSDLYSLALVANEAVTGSRPHVADTVVGTMMARSEAPADLSPELGELRSPLERAGRLDPAQRPEADELTISLLAAAETMSRPGPLPLVGPYGVESEPQRAVEPTALVLELPDTPVEIDEPTVGADDLEIAEVDTGGSTTLDEPALAVVPGVDDAPDRGALEDLDRAEPSFVDEPAEPETAPALDVPTRPVSTSGVFRPEDDDLDDQLPMWPLAVLVALVAAGVAAWFLLSGAGTDDTVAPSLVGLTDDELSRVVADADFEIRRLEIRSNDSVPGTVLHQDPAAGVPLDDGTPLTVTVSLGAEMVEIPDDLPGLSLDQARERLRVAGLDVGAISREASEQLDADLVIGLDEPTRQKPQGATVALRVSTGPEDRVVPDTLIGTSIADATAQLVGLRLQGLEEQVYDPVAAPGTVLGSLPAAGESVPADSQITLLVSAGPEPVEMPDLADLSLAEAVDALDELGLVFADTEGTPGEPVIGTIPPVGEIVDVGSEVVIVLAEPDPDGEDDDDGSEGDADG